MISAVLSTQPDMVNFEPFEGGLGSAIAPLPGKPRDDNIFEEPQSTRFAESPPSPRLLCLMR